MHTFLDGSAETLQNRPQHCSIAFFTMTDAKAIREYFTDAEWDLIDYALSEYQDHDEDADACRALLTKIGNMFTEVHK